MKKSRKKTKKVMLILLSVIAILAVVAIIFINQPSFGRIPGKERLERIQKSTNYKNGKFLNLNETPQLTGDKGFFGSMIDFLFRKDERITPKDEIPAIKTDLHALDRNENIMIWFGHSSYLMQIDGKRILVDPVFSGAASPVSFVNKPFKGTDIYKPEDIPDIDYLVISHDHWDHLDYKTVMQLKPRVQKVICGLGVGEHFEYWGFESIRLVELDWNENRQLDEGFNIYCLPARHFSGRGLSPNKSLWASFLIRTPTMQIYMGGDSGYDTHYKAIGEHFGEIDLAILENGQYDEGWKYIHMMPEEVLDAAEDLNANMLLTVHHAKYALGKHSWKEPLERVVEANKTRGLHLITPMIGEKVILGDSTQVFGKWWEALE